MYAYPFLDSHSLLEKLANKRAIRKAERVGQYEYDKAVRKYGADSPYTQRVAAKHGISIPAATSPASPVAPTIPVTSPTPSPIVPTIASASSVPPSASSAPPSALTVHPSASSAPPGAPATSKFKNALNYIKNNPGKVGGLTAAGILGAYGAKKLYDRRSGNQKTAAYEQGYYDAIEKIAKKEEESKSRLPILRHGSRVGGGIALPLAGIYGGGRLAEHLATTHGAKITNETLRKALPHAKNIGRGLGGVAGLATAYGLNKALEKKSAYEQGYYDAIEKIAQQKERETHTGKILGGAGIAGLGAYLNSQGNHALNNLDEMTDYLHGQHPHMDRDDIRRLSEKISKGIKGVGKGAMGLGGLMAGYGGYKTYLANKNQQK